VLYLRGQIALTICTPAHFGVGNSDAKRITPGTFAASVRLQIAKPLRMSASGLRSQGSGEIDS
jgi:hypothetical protein